MNHVFAALAVAAFGMVVLGGDASAAPAATQPAGWAAHHGPQHVANLQNR